ncbi:hypothetical protein TWF788_010047 [Orbilia oligospora]|uniref:Uncharacterized protein n=1 Tax=Orbilia oligospora TaxID=2813651 RepID=A0A7C8KJM1_ORBOL|nr:hypothetical protein TWF788_010047 [Orbilia oligospora]
MGEILETTSIAAKDGHAVTAIKDITYGSIAGMVGKFIEYPFDTVKVRLQTQNHFKGPLDCFTQGLRNDGITGLYRGIAPPLVGAAAENAGLFFGYTASQNVIRQSFYSSYDPEQKLPMPALVTCGAIAGAFFSEVIKAHGILGMWHGQSGTFLRETGGSARMWDYGAKICAGQCGYIFGV